MSNQVVMDNVAERLETAPSSHSSVVFTMATCLQETDESNRKIKVHREDFEQLSDITVTRDCKVFFVDASKNCVYQGDIANPPTIKKLSFNKLKQINEPTGVSHFHGSTDFLFICHRDGLLRINVKTLTADKVTSIFIQRPFKMFDMTDSKLGFWVTDIGNNSVYRVPVSNEQGKKFCLSYEFIRPSGLACLSSQNLVFVSDSYKFEVLAFSEEGYPVWSHKLPNHSLPNSLSSSPFSESILFIAGSQHLCKLEGNLKDQDQLCYSLIAGQRYYPDPKACDGVSGQKPPGQKPPCQKPPRENL